MKETIPDSAEEKKILDENQINKGGVHTFIDSFAISSTWLFTLAVIGTGIISIVLFIYGFILSFTAIIRLVFNFNIAMVVVKEYLSTAIEIIDIFLIATVFYLMSLGLYELFIAKAPLPGWIRISTLDDLKTKLLGLIVIALSVIFLGTALTLSIATNILEFGAAIALMIISISVYLWVKG